MEEPNKLHCMHRMSGDYSCSTTPFGGSVEYIRKDALIEWAERMKSICKGAEPIVKAYQTVIDKIESL